MVCPRCQAENREGRRYCGECGAPLPTPCASCGFANEAGEKYCGGCGQPLGAPRQSQAPPIAEPRYGAPQDYTPHHLAERILTSRAALEGERKQVTVLFADLKGSMELIQGLDPEEARALLDPALHAMMAAVHRYEGTVNQVLGDGIMALFGAPLAHEDHALRACYAALALQEALGAYGAQVRRSHGVEVQARVGLNSGEVVVRAIGNDLHMDYTAVGETTHLAARMEQLALPGSVRLTSATLRLVEGLVRARALGPIPVKGLGEPVEVYELLAAAPTRTRLQAAAARGLTRFVGRDAELETLRRTLEQVSAGHGQVVAVVGEPGVGKSRLVWEFTHSHRTQGWLVLESGSVSYGKATSYLPVIDLLKSYWAIDAADDARRRREKVLGKLLTLDRDLEPLLPAFLALLDVPAEDAAWDALDPPQRRRRTLDACKRLLLRESQEQPLLLVFVDLHWIDAETQALLDSLVDSLPTARLLLLVNYRPEYEHTWHRKTYYQQLRLDPLPAASAEELLVALLGAAAELGPLKRVLIARTEGNPFFVEESVRTLIESGALAGERGSYRLARPFDSTHVPATVQAVLAARIDRLAPEDKRLLQAAAVIGKDVPYPLLQALAELSEPELRAGLGRLQAGEFLYETSLFPDLEYTFKHALTHEVAYGSLLQERRRTLHARIVTAIEALYQDRIAEQVERLAHHALRGEVWDQAVVYCREAGARAVGRSASHEAAVHLEEAVGALAHLPGTRATRTLAIDLRLELRAVLVPLAHYTRAAEVLEEAASIAEAMDDRRRLGQITSHMTVCFMALGQHDRALDAARRGLALAEGTAALDVQAESNFRLGQIHYLLGDFPRAIGFLEQNVRLLTGERAWEHFTGVATFPAASARTFLAYCLVQQGAFARAITENAEAVRLAEAIGHAFTRAGAWFGVGSLDLVKGNFEQAVPALERSRAIAEAGQVVTMAAYSGAALSTALARLGRVELALALLDEAARRDDFTRSMVMQAVALLFRGETHLVVGQLDAARAIAHSVHECSRRQGEQGHEAWSLRLLAEITAAADPPETDQAEGYYRQALTLADELGMRPLVAHCHLGLGTLYLKVGRAEQARAELASAIELYRAMEMTFWLAKAEAAMATGAG